jgi:putative transposase
MTFACYQRLRLLRHPSIMSLFVETLMRARNRMGFKLYACVVMPEHVHLIFRPAPGSTWAAIGASIKTSVARQVVGRWRELDAPILSRLRTERGEIRFWQRGGGFDRNIRDREELAREIGYTHRNPVRRGLVKWSTVHWWMGERGGVLLCDLPPGDAKAWIAWKGYV